MGGIESQFHFLGFKIDSISLWVKPVVGLIQHSGAMDPANLVAGVAFRKPLYLKKLKQYVGGVVLMIRLFEKPAEESSSIEGTPENPELLKLDLSITGLFGVDERMEQELERKLVRVQIPALLFPYLRSAVSSVLACAGFAAPVLPLVNMQTLAQQAQGELEIQERE